jgi:membrane-bound lytic murein transglycosylase MltF
MKIQKLLKVEVNIKTVTKTLVAFLIATFLLSPVLRAQEQPQKASINMDLVYKKWTGDLDAMAKRRIIRVLVAYNKTTYFVDKGTQRGIAYDAMKLFEDDLNKKLKTGNLKVNAVFIPVSREKLLTGLVDGTGDVSIGNLTITPERLKTVDFTDPTAKNGSEIVVTGPGAPAINTVDDLSGQEVFVRKTSSYYESLTTLNQRFKKEGKKEMVIKESPENLETEDLIEMANAGLIKILIVDNSLAEFWKQMFADITLHPQAAVRTGANYGWAIRQNSPQLKAELNAFIKTHGKGTTFGNVTFQKYLKSVKYVKNATSEAEIKKFRTLLALFQKYGDQYKVDWLLMAAQGYQESRLDQTVKSPVGAIGVMQVMPATGADMKVGDITQLDPNIQAGIKYMRFMMDQYYKNDPMDDLNKTLMTFASYNCGPNRMKSLRTETQKRGLDPNKWFGNVERVVSEKVGQETVTYVSNIYKYYIAYKLSMDQAQRRRELKHEGTKN